MDPRDLEASLLLKAAAKLQAVLEAWDQKPPSALADALLYNRRLWIVFMLSCATKTGCSRFKRVRTHVSGFWKAKRLIDICHESDAVKASC